MSLSTETSDRGDKRERIKVLSEVVGYCDFFFIDALSYSRDELLGKAYRDRATDAKAALERSVSAIDALAKFSHDELESTMRALASELTLAEQRERKKLAAELRAKADVELAAMRQKAMNDIEAARGNLLRTVLIPVVVLGVVAVSWAAVTRAGRARWVFAALALSDGAP